jgi:hypothetical protein
MRILNLALAAAALTLTLASTAPDASARGFHGGFHHSHWGHRFHQWGFRSHFGYRHFHYGYRWGHRWGYRYGYRSYGVNVAAAPRVCPPGTHLGYLGRFCHPNRD